MSGLPTTIRVKMLNYHRQANQNRTIEKLRDIFLYLIMEPNADLRNAIPERLAVSISKYPAPIVLVL